MPNGPALIGLWVGSPGRVTVETASDASINEARLLPATISFDRLDIRHPRQDG